jgi:hypothetical protein
VNIRNTFGDTALETARMAKTDDVACLIREHMQSKKSRNAEDA